MKKLRYDILLIALALAAAGILWLTLRPTVDGGTVVVRQAGEEIGRYPLHGERTVTIGDADYNILEIRDGQAMVTDANCGDHTCIRTGAISREGETIICLPHRLEIRVVGGKTPDVDVVVQ